MVADHPIDYSVVDLGVEFFVKPDAMALMEERNFHVDPNTFVQGMGGVTISGISGQANVTGGGGGYGGGGYGGYGGGGYGGQGGYGGGIGGYGGGGYGGQGGYGGGGYGGQGGYGGGGYGGQGGYGGGGYGGQGGYGGGGYGGQGGYGGGGYGGYRAVMAAAMAGRAVMAAAMAARAVTAAAAMAAVGTAAAAMAAGGRCRGLSLFQQWIHRPFLISPARPRLRGEYAGDRLLSCHRDRLDPTNNNGAFVIFNERTGDILIRATVEQLDIVERVIELLNKIPQEVQVDTKFCSVDQTDSKGLNFGLNLGNFSVGKGAVGIEGGAAPSYQGNPTVNNPSGVFPGPGPVGADAGQIAPSASDTDLTAGLRSIAPGAPSAATAPATIATITGILTDPQFRMTINAIEQRAGSDLLAAPE